MFLALTHVSAGMNTSAPAWRSRSRSSDSVDDRETCVRTTTRSPPSLIFVQIPSDFAVEDAPNPANVSTNSSRTINDLQALSLCYRWALVLSFRHLRTPPGSVLGLLGQFAGRRRSGSWPDSDHPSWYSLSHDSVAGQRSGYFF